MNRSKEQAIIAQIKETFVGLGGDARNIKVRPQHYNLAEVEIEYPFFHFGPYRAKAILTSSGWEIAGINEKN